MATVQTKKFSQSASYGLKQTRQLLWIILTMNGWPACSVVACTGI